MISVCDAMRTFFEPMVGAECGANGAAIEGTLDWEVTDVPAILAEVSRTYSGHCVLAPR